MQGSLAIPVVPAEPSFAGYPRLLDFGLREGCISSQLDHGLEHPSGKAALAADLITAAAKFVKIDKKTIILNNHRKR